MTDPRRKGPPPRPPEFDADLVRDISEAVFRDRLGKDLAQMLTEDNDSGKKLRKRASSYDALTRCYMRAMSAAWSPSRLADDGCCHKTRLQDAPCPLGLVCPYIQGDD